MPEKVTTMVLNTVDLQCSCCYKKVKKVLRKFPEIRDQVYDEKNNKVTIKVMCCSPEKIRDKLSCKGGKYIKSIQIVDDPPKAPKKPKAPEKPKEAEKPKAPEKPKEVAKPKAPEKPKEEEKPKPPAEKPKAPAPHAPEPLPMPICGPDEGYPPMPMYPSGTCCESCYHGYGGGPCYQGYGRPVPPPPGPCYEGYGRPVPPPPGPCYEGYGRPVPLPPGPCYEGYGRHVPPPPGPCYQGYGRPVPPPPGPCYDSRYRYRRSKCGVSTDYFSEDNSQGCTVM